MPTTNPNVGLAFGLTVGASAATAIGAAIVFVPRLVQYAHRKTLAGALGLSAGVITYVSFVEIFKNSVQAFVDAGNSDKIAYIYGTLSFFGGTVAMLVSLLHLKIGRKKSDSCTYHVVRSY
jgi:ZIP family zinc transporter